SVICGFADRFEGPRRQSCRTIGIDRSDVGPGPPDGDVTLSPSVDRERHSAWRLAVYGTANREPSDRESSSGRARMDSRVFGPLVLAPARRCRRFTEATRRRSAHGVDLPGGPVADEADLIGAADSDLDGCLGLVLRDGQLLDLDERTSRRGIGGMG